MAIKGADELTRVVLDQALYGYRRGHELLAGSVELRPESRASLLVFTDMSGPSLVPGFESYLTGVPLTADGVYAFARTWYAPEMSRPGCVWTHVLLIKRADLAQLTSLESLLPLFRRPQEGSFETFESTLLLNNPTQSDVGPIDSGKAENLLDAFYSNPRPLMITSTKPEEYENLVLALWSQQGPDARFAFSFCTGAMSNRKLKGGSLTLQIIPPEVRRQVERESDGAVLLDLGESREHREWLRSLAGEMTSHHLDRIGRLIRALDLYGDNRVILPIIAPVVLAERESNAVELIQALLKATAAAWPTPKDGEALKNRFFTDAAMLGKLLKIDLGEADLLRGLSLCLAPAAFDASSLKLRERGGHLWSVAGSAARALALDLLNGEGNELGDEVLSGLMEAAPDSELWSLVERKSALVLALLQRDSSLAQSPRLWKLQGIRAADLLDAIRQPSSAMGDVMIAALEAGRFDAALQILERHGSDGARAAFEWLAKSSGVSNDVPSDFLKALGRHHEIALNFLHQPTIHSEAAALLLFCLDIDSVEALPPEFLLEALKKGFGRVSKSVEHDVEAVILARGLKFAQGGDRMVAATFESVHRALAVSNIGYEAWKSLDRILPSVLWRDWDKCERLRKGLVEKIVENHWSSGLIFEVARNEDTFRSLLKTCRASSKGRSLLRRAQKESAAAVVSSLQKRLLKSEDDSSELD